MTPPSWLGRAVRNRHRHAIEQASRRWPGGRRDDSARTRRKLISTQATLGTRTRALWVPYEAIKDGSPRQRKALAAVLDFLNLDRRATITADTTHDSPGATANYVADAERCRATLAPNPYLGTMLDDPYFPYGKAPH